MVSVQRKQFIVSKTAERKYKSLRPLNVLQGSLFHRKVPKKYPLLIGLHKAMDGALLGSLLAVTMMTAFTLHWQYLWTIAFSQLERTRDLTHKLTDSTATLERYLIKSSNLPVSMVPTKASDLLYLESPEARRDGEHNNYDLLSFYKTVRLYNSNHGY